MVKSLKWSARTKCGVQDLLTKMSEPRRRSLDVPSTLAVQIKGPKALEIPCLPFDQNETPLAVIAFTFPRLKGEWDDDSGITGKELFDQFPPF